MAVGVLVQLVVEVDEFDLVELGERTAMEAAGQAVLHGLGAYQTGLSSTMWYFERSKRPADHPVGVYMYER